MLVTPTRLEPQLINAASAPPSNPPADQTTRPADQVTSAEVSSASAIPCTTSAAIKEPPALRVKYQTQYVRCKDLACAHFQGRTASDLTITHEGSLELLLLNKGETASKEATSPLSLHIDTFGSIIVSHEEMWNTVAAVFMGTILVDLCKLGRQMGPTYRTSHKMSANNDEMTRIDIQIAILKQLLKALPIIKESWNGKLSIDRFLELITTLCKTVKKSADQGTRPSPAQVAPGIGQPSHQTSMTTSTLRQQPDVYSQTPVANRTAAAAPEPGTPAAALLNAITSGNIGTCETLINSHHQDQEFQKHAGSALLLAAQAGHDALCELLIETFPKCIAQTDEQGITPLHWSALKGMVAVCRKLLQTASKENNEAAGKLVLAPDINSKTSLHYAAVRGHTSVCQILLEAAPQAALYIDMQRRTALHLAACGNHTGVCHMLLQWAPALDMSVDETQSTALHLAAARGQTDVCMTLLDINSNLIGIVNGKGQTPVQIAAESGRIDLCRLLQDRVRVAPVQRSKAALAAAQLREAERILARAPGDPNFVSSASLAADTPAKCTAPSPDQFNVTTGGAQGFEKAIAEIDRGQIPKPEDCTIDAIIKQIELQLNPPKCGPEELQHGCGMAVIKRTGHPAKVYLQMSANVEHDRSQGRMTPALLRVVVDKSGSMNEPSTQGAAYTRDGKNTRMALVRESLKALLDEFKETDVVGVSEFDSQAKEVQKAAPFSKEEMIKTISGLQPNLGYGNTTNLEQALIHSIAKIQEDLTKMKGSPCFPIVLMYTDAQANEAELDPDILKKHLDRAYKSGVKLIIVGMGEARGLRLPVYDSGFNQGSADKLTPNGACFYVSSQTDMKEFTRNLSYRLEPFADRVMISITLEGLNLKLTETFGGVISETKDGETHLSMKIPLLFLVPSSEGGGATLFELVEEVEACDPDAREQLSITQSKIAAFIVKDFNGLLHKFKVDDEVQMPGMPKVKIVDIISDEAIAIKTTTSNIRQVLTPSQLLTASAVHETWINAFIKKVTSNKCKTTPKREKLSPDSLFLRIQNNNGEAHGRLQEDGVPVIYNELKDPLGKIIYRGALNINGLPHGLGISYHEDGSYFAGEHKAGHYEGLGLYVTDGVQFWGEWVLTVLINGESSFGTGESTFGNVLENVDMDYLKQYVKDLTRQRSETLEEFEKRTGGTKLHYVASLGDVKAFRKEISLIRETQSKEKSTPKGQGESNVPSATKPTRKRDHEGRTALHLAALNGHRLIYQELIYADESLSTKTDNEGPTPSLLTITDNEGLTPFLLAASENQTGIMRILEPWNLEPYKEMDRKRNTILHLAARNGHQNVIELIRKKIDEIDDSLILKWINQKNDDGFDAVTIADFYGKEEMVKYLKGIIDKTAATTPLLKRV